MEEAVETVKGAIDEMTGIIEDVKGKVEGYLPVKNQSKLEYYEKNDRIKALIVDIKPTNTGIQLILSRSDTPYVYS